MGLKLTKIQYRQLYKLLDKITPLEEDCGNLCAKICCKQESTDLGMYLLPGEESLFTGKEDWLVWEKQNPKDFDFPDSWTDSVFFIRCTRDCPREKRPIQCRTFPLTPHLTATGTLLLIRETLPLPYQCPLIIQKIPLRPTFMQTVYQVWSKLIQDPRIYDLVEFDSLDRTEPLDVVYPTQWEF